MVKVLFLIALTLSAASGAPQNVVLQAVPLGSVPGLAHTVAHGPAVIPHTIAHAPAVVRTVVPAVAPEPAIVETIDPSYRFGYSVTDTKTGDAKAREEVRDGDLVTGSYTVADPDGRIRKVTYTADAVNGFQAVVTYDGVAGPPAIPINTPAAIAAPVATAPIASTPVIQEVRGENSAPVLVHSPLVHHAPAGTVLRTSPFGTHLVNHAAGAVHAIPHSSPATVVRTSPFGTHLVNHAAGAVHAIPHHAAPTTTFLRTHHAAPTQFGPTATFIRNADGSLTQVSAINSPFLHSTSHLPLVNSAAFFNPQLQFVRAQPTTTDAETTDE